MRKRRLCSIAATVVLSLCCACADDGAVPAVEPDPEPEPEQSEPFLTVSPDTLFYDLVGKPLGASEFAVKTNCAWRLSVPEQADWCEASATSGQYDASVSFRLGGDPCYRVAELTFAAIAADGKPVISCPVFVQQGEKPDVDPTEPSDPDERPTDPSDPDDSSDPDKDPETSPAIPKIESVNPTALVWSASESGVVRQVDVTVKDFENRVLEPKITGTDAGRFEALVKGLTIEVKTTGKNDTDADYRATLEISVADGNSMSVSLLQSKRESEPDSGDSGDNSGDGDSNGDGGDGGDSNGGDDGDDGDGGGNGDGGDGGDSGDGDGNGEESGEPDDPPGGGCDDFATLEPSSQCTKWETRSGWQGFYCAVYSGDNGNDTEPYFRSLLGRSPDVKGLAMYTTGGRIESPELHGGCGSLTFRYGVTEANKTVDFTVEIVQNGTPIKSWSERKAVTQYQQNEFSAAVQLAGDFRIVIRNNASSTAEYTTVFQIAWTGYSAKIAAK